MLTLFGNPISALPNVPTAIDISTTFFMMEDGEYVLSTNGIAVGSSTTPLGASDTLDAMKARLVEAVRPFYTDQYQRFAVVWLDGSTLL